MSDIIRIFRPIGMILVSYYLKLTKKCNVSVLALMNGNTVLEGYNKIEKNTCISNSKIGYSSYLSSSCELANCIVGRYCSIGGNLKILSASHPTHTFVSSHPAFYSVNKQSGYTYVDKSLFDEYRYFDKTNGIEVKIGNDVWIGYNVTIMGGLEIGDGAIIATGSIITKDVRPFSIVGGVPAKELKRRFTDRQVDFLMDFKWWQKTTKWIEENAGYFKDIDLFIEKQKINK